MNYPKDYRFNSRKIVFLCVLMMGCLLFSNKSNASHVIGGEMTYSCLGNNQFEIKLTVYRDCFFGNSNAQFDNEVSIGVFDLNNDLILDINNGFEPGEIRMFYTTDDTLTNITSDSCFTVNNEICVHSATYVDTIFLPELPGGYQLSYQRCCRNSNLNNIVDPANTGATFYTYISDEALEGCYSSPQFGTLPPAYICINEPFVIDQSVINVDVDADSILYNLCTPLNGGTFSFPQPQPPGPPPYEEINWNAPNFDYFNPLGGVPLTIDTQTGILTGTPNSVGLFVFGLCIEMYKDGKVVSSTRRDVQISVGVCSSLSASFEVPEIQCNDLEVAFQNTSNNTDSYNWNFGDPNSNNNTSTETNPSHVFSGAGTYEVRLIVEPGSSCADTAFQTIQIVNSDLTATFDYLILDCGNDLVLHLNDNSSVSSANIIARNWNVNGQTSTQTNPTFIIPSTGNTVVQLEVISSDGCSETNQTIFANEPDLGSFLPTGLSICSGEQIEIDLEPLPFDGFKYKWTPASSLINPNSPSPTASPLVTTVYTLTLTNDDSGCEQEFEVTVEVNDIDINIDVSSAFCGGSSVLSASTNVSPVDFIWSDNIDFNNTLSDSSSLQVSEFGQNTYYVKVSTSSNCTATESITIIEESINVTLNNSLLMCLGEEETIELVNLDQSDDLSVIWSPSVGIVSGGNSSSVVISPQQAGEFTYYVEATNQYNCTYFDSVQVNVIDPLEQPEIVYLQECNSTVVNIDHIGANFPYYFWEIDQGNGIVDTVIGPSINYTFPSAGIFKLTLNPVAGLPCNLQTEEFEIVVLEKIVESDFEWSYVDCYENIVLQFDDASIAHQGNINSWLWTFNNGDISIQQNPTIVLNTAEDFEVQLIVTSDLGCADTLDKIITPSFADIPPLENVLSICENGSIALYPNGDPAFQYQWAPADLLDDATAVSPIANPTVSTTFQVTITDPLNNNCEIYETVEVNIDNDIEINLEVSTIFCGVTTVLTASSNIMIENIIWSDENDFNNVLSDSSSLTVSELGQNIYYVKVFNSNGCSAIDSIIIVEEAVNVTLENSILMCLGEDETIELQNLDLADDLTVNWSPSVGIVSGGNTSSVVISPPQSGQVTYYVEATNQYNCTYLDSVQVTVIDPLEQPEIIFSQECNSNEVSISHLGTNFPYYSWEIDLGNGTVETFNGPNVNYTFPSAGIYKLTLSPIAGLPCNLPTEEFEIVVLEENISAGFDGSYVDCYENLILQFTDATVASQGNISSWLWQFSNGDVSIQQDPIIELTSADDLEVRLIVTTDLGCTDTLDQIISPSLTEIPPLENVLSICEGESIALYSNGDPAFQYQWAPADLLDDTNAVSPIAQPTASTTFQVTITDTQNNNCEIYETVEVNINDDIEINLSVSSTFCGGSSVLIASSNLSPVDFIWSDNIDFNNVLSDSSSLTVSELGQNTYYVKVSSPSGCTATESITIIEEAVNVTLNNSVFMCLGEEETIELVNLDPADDLTVNWSPSTGIVSGGNTSSVIISPPQTGQFIYYVEATNQYTCTYVDSVQVTVIDPLEQPKIEYSQGCNTDEINMVYSGSNFPYYSWEIVLGNGTVETFSGSSINYTFPSAGVYELILSPIAGLPCILPTEKFEIVVLEENISASFDWTYIDCYENLILQFTDETTASQGNISSWLWQFSSGDVSIQQDPIIELNTAQDLEVRLIVTSDLGCADTLDHVITTSFTEIPPLENVLTLCENEPVELYPNGDPGLEYQWSPSTGLDNANVVSPMAQPLQTTTYSVTITDPQNNNCEINEQVEVIVPTQFIEAGFDYQFNDCSPDSFTIVFSDASIVGGNNIESWNWTFSDGQSASGESVLFVIENADEVEATLEVISDNGCSSIFSQTIDLQSIGLSLEDEIIKCAGSPVSLNPNGDSSFSYQWSPASDLVNGATAVNPIANPIVTTTYCATITNGSCQTTDCITVVVPDAPLIPTFSIDIGDCVNEAVISFQDETVYSLSEIVAWNWTFGNGTTSEIPDPIVTVYQDTILEVELQVTTADGCQETSTESIEIDLISLELESEIVLCDGGGTFLNPNGDPDQTYLWTPSTGLDDPTSHNPFADPNVSLTYSVEVSNGPCLIVETVSVVIPSEIETEFEYTIDGCTDVAVIDFTDESIYNSGDIVAWNWQFSNGDTSSLENLQLTLDQSQMLEVELTVTTSEGCSASYNESLEIDLIDINVQDTIISCDGGVVELNAGGNPDYSYQWSPTTGLLGSATSPNPTADPANSITYTVVVTAGACEITRTVDVIVPTDPIEAAFEYNFDDCTDNAVIEFTDLSQYSNAPITSWKWEFIGTTTNLTSDLQNPVIIIDQSEEITASLTISTEDGCEQTISEVIVVDLIDINITSAIVFCPSQTLILNPNGNSTYTYNWAPAALLSDADAPSPQVLGLFQDTEFTVTVTSGNCSLTRTTEIKFPDIPLQAAFDMTYETCVDSSTILLNDRSLYSGTVVEWDWQVGNDTSTLESPSFTFNQEETLDVQLIVTSDEGCKDTINNPIDVKILDVNLDNTVSSCNGDGTFLNPNGDPNLEYRWSPNIGINNDTLAVNPYASPTSSMSYFVQITDPSIGCSDELEVAFNVPTIPLSAGFDWAITSCSDSTTVELVDTSTYSGIIGGWQWKVENGFQSEEQHPTFVFPNSDVFDVQLVVSTIDGCVDSTTVQIEVDVMDVGVIADSITSCGMTNSISLNPNGNPNLIYNWSPSATLDVPNSYNPLATPTTGLTEYSVTITNPNNLNCFDIRTVVVQISEQTPLVIFPYSQDTVICNAGIELEGKSEFATNYEWSDDSNFQNILSNSVILNTSPLEPTMYYFKATNNFGCGDIDSIMVTPDIISIQTPEDKIICSGETIPLPLIIPQGQGADWEYEWEMNDGIVSGENTSEVIVSPLESTEFIFTVNSNDGCELIDSVSVTVVDLEKLIEIEADTEFIDEGESVQLSVQDIPGLDYEWTPCDESVSNCNIPDPIVAPLTTTLYIVEVSDMDNACFYKDSIRISVDNISACEEPYIFVPKGFTPNDDGLNDILYVRGNAIDEMTFAVFNRWGEKVFETTDKSQGWDGTIDGQKLPPDVFGYYLTVKCIKGEVFNKQGNITLIR